MKKKYIPFLIITFIIFLFLVYIYREDLSPGDQNAAVATPQELKEAGLFDVTTYGADKTGNNDSTTAIRNAMKAAFTKDAVIFFPPGTYKVTDTLTALDDRSGLLGEAFHFMGSTAGENLPVIKLASGSFNDNVDSNNNVYEDKKKKAVIHMWACEFEEKADEGRTPCDPPYDTQLSDVNATNGNTAMFLGNSIQNIKIVIENNNPDAIGIRMTGNQRNALSNVEIETGDGFAGIMGSVGTNSTNQDITITGGKYGVYGSYGGWGAYTNVTLINQEILAFTSHRGPPVSLNGFEIIKDTAPAIGEVEGESYTEVSTYHMGSYSLNDGVINFTNSSTNPAISTLQGGQIAVVNVYVNKAAKLLQTEDFSQDGNANGWSRIREFANTIPTAGYKLIEGVETQTDYIPTNAFIIQNVSAPNAVALKMNHGVEEGRIPSPDELLNLSKIPNSGVVNVVDRGIIPQENPLTNDDPDYSGKLNELFNDSSIKYVFLPKGVYPIKNTITLGKNTHLIGVTPNTSRIRVHPLWRPGNRVDALQTVNDANATTAIANVQIVVDTNKGNNKFDTIHWRAGRLSIIYYAHAETFGSLGPQKCPDAVDRYGNERNDYLFDGNGGGRVWGTATGGGGCSKYHEKYRGLLVNGTTQPLTIYGFNPEDGHGEVASEREGYQAEIRNAKNVSIKSHKSEDANSLLVRNSENIFIFNPGGSIDWALRDNNKIAVYNTVSKFKEWPIKGSDKKDIKDMIEEEVNGNITKKYRSTETVSIIKRGEVDYTVWDLASDLPFYTSTPIPEDTAEPAPRDTDTPTPTPTLTTTPNTSATATPIQSVTPSPTRVPGSSPTPTSTPIVQNTPTPQIIAGSVCGRADSDNNGVFDIVDFVAFAAAYQDGNRSCDDRTVDYGLCGGRDVDRDGRLNIADFGGTNGFASRYFPKTSCSLN